MGRQFEIDQDSINEFKQEVDKDILYVDTREPDKIFTYLDKYEITYKLKALPIGDFIKGNVCIERKTVTDLVSSLQSGHLKKQLIQMNDNFNKSFLIISGTYEDLLANEYIQHWTLNHHCGMLAHILCRYPNVKMAQVKNDSQLVNLVGRIITKAFDGKIPTIMDTELMMLRGKMGTDHAKLMMMACIPKISFKRAEELLNCLDIKIIKKDGTEITEDYLQRTIPGIGPGLSKEILRINRDE